MFREIFTKRILGAIAFAIVFGMACYALGMWQLSRYEAKDARANAVETNYARAAVSLAQVLPSPAATLAEDQIWTKVTVTGRYAVDRTLVVRTRSLASTLGLEVLVPLRVGDATLLVDRGWVRMGETAGELPPFPAAPAEEVTLTGWLKPSEDDRGQNLPAGQLASINLAQAQAQTGGTLYQAYLVLDTERTASGVTPQRPRRWGTSPMACGMKQVTIPIAATTVPASMMSHDLGASPNGVFPRVIVCRATRNRSRPKRPPS